MALISENENISVLNRSVSESENKSGKLTYITFHRKTSAEATDSISLDDIIKHDKQKNISYMVITNNKVIKFTYWDLDSAIHIAKSNFNPDTRQPLNPNFKDRVLLQYELKKYTIPKENELSDLLKILFKNYIKGEKLDDQSLCYLKNYLHIDDSGILSEWETLNSLLIRDIAIKKIQDAEIGSWIIRGSSVEATDIFKPRVITFKDKDSIIKHFLICHIYGYGYVHLYVNRGTVLPSSQNRNYNFPEHDNIVFPSFIDLLEHYSNKLKFDISKIIVNSQL